MSWSGPRKIGYPTPPYKKATGVDAKKIQHMEDKYPGREVWLSDDGKKGYAGKPIDGKLLSKKGEKVLSKKGEKVREKITKKRKKLKESETLLKNKLRKKALEDPFDAIRDYPEKLDEKTFRDVVKKLGSYNIYKYFDKIADRFTNDEMVELISERIAQMSWSDIGIIFRDHSEKLNEEIINKIALLPKISENILSYAPNKLSEENFKKVALLHPEIALDIAGKRIIETTKNDKGFLNKIAEKAPKAAFSSGMFTKLDNKMLNKLALSQPYSAIQYAYDLLKKETQKKLIELSPSAALRHLSTTLDDKALLKASIARPAIALADDYIIDRLATNKSIGLIAGKAYPNVYGAKVSDNVRDKLFYSWVHAPNSFIAEQFRDNIADILNIKNTSKVSKHLVSFPEKTKKVINDTYKETQKLLKKDYPSGYVPLYRGINSRVDVPYGFNSFSVSRDTAESFNGHDILEINVPIEKILSYPKSGSVTGEMKEQEYIVMGNYNEF